MYELRYECMNLQHLNLAEQRTYHHHSRAIAGMELAPIIVQ